MNETSKAPAPRREELEGSAASWKVAKLERDVARLKAEYLELWGVLNAVRVATRFGKPVGELLPRMDEVLGKSEREAA